MKTRQSFIQRKRIFDTFLVFATTPLWGLLLLTGTLITLIDTGWPCFFMQRRMGLDRQPFDIYKIRTMNPMKSAPTDALFDGWTYPNDPRVTRVGRFLRRYRIDELPQLINILRGEMSLVGPRPEPWEVALELGEKLPRYHDRHSVRPGLTGLCQVSSAYLQFGTIEQSAVKLEYDLDYVDQHSSRLDFTILGQTIAVIIRGGGVS